MKVINKWMPFSAKRLVIFCVLVICFSQNLFGQILIEKDIYKKKGNPKMSLFDKFKKTTTIFVLSLSHNKEDYEGILENIWDVTSFKVVSMDSFDVTDYLKDDYSFVLLDFYKNEANMVDNSGGSLSRIVEIETAIYVHMYANNKVLKKLSRQKKGIDQELLRFFLDKYKLRIGKIPIQPKEDLKKQFYEKGVDILYEFPYQKNHIWGGSLGFLKNNFMKLNTLLKNKESSSLKRKYYLSHLGKLANQTLFVPKNATARFVRRDRSYLNKGNNFFESYAYKYNILSEGNISKRILKGEDLLYVRHVRYGRFKYFQIVDSATGDILYNRRFTGITYNLQGKQLKELNKLVRRFSRNTDPK